MVNPPSDKGEAPPQILAKTDIVPAFGQAPESQGPMVPYHLIGPIIEAKVGQMKAEFERDFREQLGKIDHLPTKWQLIATVASAVVVAITALFGIMAYFGDRQDAAIDRSAVMSQSLTRIEDKMDRIPAQEKPANGKQP